jgi:hypothetical protein
MIQRAEVANNECGYKGEAAGKQSPILYSV